MPPLLQRKSNLDPAICAASFSEESGGGMSRALPSPGSASQVLPVVNLPWAMQQLAAPTYVHGGPILGGTPEEQVIPERLASSP